MPRLRATFDTAVTYSFYKSALNGRYTFVDLAYEDYTSLPSNKDSTVEDLILIRKYAYNITDVALLGLIRRT